MTQTTAYKPSFLQKILGRNYKWWFAILYNFRLSLAYRTTAVFIIARDLVPIFISLAIYGSLSESSPYLSYILIANVFYKIVLWFGDIAWEISSNIRYGGISSKLMRPTNWLIYEFFAVFGGNAYTFLVNFLILLGLVYFNGFQIIFGSSLILALILVLISICSYFCIDLIFGSVSFWTPETNTLIEMKMAISPFLAGCLVLFDLNKNLEFLKYLPWSFISYHPMQIYLGKYTNLQIFYVFFGGVIWSIILYFLAKLVFKMGLKRNEAVGL